MIANIKFLITGKIKDLKPENIEFYCGCKALKVDSEDAEVDVLVDLCPIHETTYEKLQAGTIKPEDAKIPQVVIKNGL